MAAIQKRPPPRAEATTVTKLISPSGLASASARRPWLTIGAWVLLAVLAVAGASQLTFTDASRIPGTGSDRAYDVLTELRGPQPITETVVVSSDRFTVDSPEYRAIVETVAGLRARRSS